jgi:hypothetical protein
MSRSTTSSAAYTLIELMIAVGLGIVICAFAFAGVRICQQTATISRRMSIETEVMRAGVLSALEQLDFWQTYDDPTDPLRQPLRDPTSSNPFRPMALDTSFDQSQAKNWWRGMPIANPSKNFGDLSLMSRIGHPVAWRRYLPETFDEINRTLGHYALCDYMPANTMFQYFGADGKVPPEFHDIRVLDPATEPRAYSPLGGNVDQARDIQFLTHTACFTLTTDATYLAAGVNRSVFGLYLHPGGGGTMTAPWYTEQMYAKCSQRESLLAIAPEHWPTSRIAIKQFIGFSRCTNEATVSCTDPVSASMKILRFSAVSSTLRGARQQRGLDVVTP